MLAYWVRRPDGDWLAVSGLDGSNERLLVRGASSLVAPADPTPIGWQSDSSRIFFGSAAGALDSWGTGYRIFSIGVDGTGLIEYPPNVHGIPSPDGKRFVYTASPDGEMHLVGADGSGDQTIGYGNHPVWSPDGSQLAFWLYLDDLYVQHLGGTTRRFTVEGGSNYGTIAWSPDSRWVYADSSKGLVEIDLQTGKRRTLAGIPPGSGTVVSPDGTRIAYAAGGECRDRTGIYVANADGTDRTRVSNSCRIVGTDGPDVIHGDFSRAVLGLDGDDTLYADDTGYFFEGISLYGGPGNDKLYGGYARDDIYGGPGNDYMWGGPSKDVLIGGPGHDHISGGGGNDLIGAQDGQRDWITCGTNRKSDGIPDHDVVYADRIDVVAADCEIVYRH